ncbi:TIGR02647 family protein [Plasticicumulans sp.]|uniref:TIGR02647 family protein n=1 Tax=Plasticicumulans sp. TaxID=2307179 RepID=UPI002C62A376|nr:TIGR02647 family protein [Plasticicumulans sp.]HMW31601.1 TIGR02647 family protein [Plasticicumulans sp.]HMW43415.1 TIGR02647 family protein [Plasticicumulans sp.]HNF66792.1 TIGR02647 family protein [Plasticicumulans sp.]HNG49603.1 TIGR02647 family protein [Plasticicumulans sp.]HNI23775.1 TIGR02647 family protein [Plasticicumulans sp.]
MSHRLSAETCAELQLLALFSTATQQSGLKVHHSAAPELVAAATRLHEKRLITQPDGGYLTDLGYEAANGLDAVLDILGAPG